MVSAPCETICVADDVVDDEGRNEVDDERRNEEDDDDVENDEAIHEVEIANLNGVNIDISTNVFVKTQKCEDCCKNYEGTSGAMESDGLLLISKKIEKEYAGSVYLDYIITDDDSTMKKYLTHPKKRPNGNVNIGGRLPLSIPEPKWFADPSHRTKCVRNMFYGLVATHKDMKPFYAMRLKKYFGYYLHQNRSKSIEELQKNAMAPLKHLFDNHEFCQSTWSAKKKKRKNH